MFNARLLLRLISTFFARFKVLIMLGVIFGILIFLISLLIAPALNLTGVKRIGITGRYSTNNLPQFVLQMIGGGLTKVNKLGDVEPNLASSWETPDKGKTWIFNLKNNSFWQDKKKLTSYDINYEFSDLITEKPDDKTLVYKLQTPYSAFPVVLSKPIFKKGLLGTGYYKVKKLSVSGSFVFSIYLIGENKEKITFKFYPTEERTKLAFRLGEVDEIREIINPSPLNGWSKLHIVKNEDKGKYIALFFNTQDELLSDKILRQSLNYALDKEVLGGERALSPISENSWAYNPQVKRYDFDPQKSRKEIKEGLSLNLSTFPLLLPTAEKIAKNWEEIGIKVNISVVSTIPDNFQALVAIFDVPEDPDQYSIWHSTQENSNITKYSNPRIDKLLEDGRIELDIEERKKIYIDFQRFLVEDSPAIFLYYPKTYTISRK